MSRKRGKTITELCWPTTPEFTQITKTWCNDASVILLQFVWQAYDLIKDEIFSRVDCNQADEELERSITQLLEPRINRVMSGFEPFYVQHGPYEEETRKPSPAQPPQYDIAFVLSEYPKTMWPLEAKVLRTDKSVYEYVKEIKDNFLTCRYAPFSSEGGMLGYLFSGNPSRAFCSIQQGIQSTLTTHLQFSERSHRISEHQRIVPSEKNYPCDFRCHHLILVVESHSKNSLHST